MVGLSKKVRDYDNLIERGSCNGKQKARAKLFFSSHYVDRIIARSICNSCNSKEVCLEIAKAYSYTCGIWGGELFRDGKIVAIRLSGRPQKNSVSEREIVGQAAKHLTLVVNN